MTVEEAKFYPTPDKDPVPLDPGELPSTYGKNRLVLLPVDPYLIYAYWELAEGLPPTGGARPILRFHETPGRPFDVEVDLTAGNWYVHLWSAGKTYQAILGVRSEDGTFAVLAESNTVQTPPAGPMPGTFQSEPQTESEQPEPQPEPLPPTPEPPPPREPASPMASTGPAITPPSTLRAEADAAAVRVYNLAQMFAQIEPELIIAVPAEAILAERIDAFPAEAALPEELGDEFFPFEESPTPLPFDLADLDELDLTDYSEQRFTPGISSQDGPLGE